MTTMHVHYGNRAFRHWPLPTISNRYKSKLPGLLLLACLLGLSGKPGLGAELRSFTGTAEAPSLDLEAWRGGRHALDDYRDRVVMVNFWAGWCHPCIQEIPELIRLAEILKDEPFTILAVNVGEKKHRLAGFVKKMDEHMTILMDTDGAEFENWKGIGLPSTFIIDPAGRIRYEAYGAVNWDRPDVVEDIRALMHEDSTTSTE